MQDAGIVKTGKLYDEDAYAVSFDAEVLSAEGNDVVLDRTLFFPEEGGQQADRGVLGGIEVADVQIRGDEIHHLLKTADVRAAGILPGKRVSGEIDRAFRFSNMQQHSGEHLFSGLVHRLFGFNNVGFHLSEREVTLDFDGVIPAERIGELEILVNRIITEDIPSRIRYVSGREREELEYRSKIDLPGLVRIVEFPGYDTCACCAPHVRRTGEIGVLIVTGMIRWKSGVRVSILCGERAVRQCRKDRDIVIKTANYLTTSPDEIYSQSVKAKEELRAMKARLTELGKRQLEKDADAADPALPDVFLFSPDAEAAAARSTVNRLTAVHEGWSGVFTGSDSRGYSFVIGAGKNADARKAAALLRQQFGAKGGGSDKMVQGSVMAAEAELKEALSGKSAAL